MFNFFYQDLKQDITNKQNLPRHGLFVLLQFSLFCFMFALNLYAIIFYNLNVTLFTFKYILSLSATISAFVVMIIHYLRLQIIFETLNHENNERSEEKQNQ